MNKPKLILVGEDGNCFYILGKAIKTAKEAGWPKEKIEKFQKEATSGDYDHLLQICMEHFEVI